MNVSVKFAAKRRFGRQIGDELGAPDGRGRLPFSGPGLAQQQRGEVLHPVPERCVVPAHVMGEDVVPERLAQLAHRFAIARERALDEVEGAPQLEEEREITPGRFLVEAAVHEIRDEVVREGHGQRRSGLLRLALDQRVDLRHVAVIADIEQRRLDQGAFLSAQILSAEPRLQPRPDEPRKRFAVPGQVAERGAGREPHHHFRPCGTEWVAEHHVRQGAEEIPV